MARFWAPGTEFAGFSAVIHGGPTVMTPCRQREHEASTQKAAPVRPDHPTPESFPYTHVRS